MVTEKTISMAELSNMSGHHLRSIPKDAVIRVQDRRPNVVNRDVIILVPPALWDRIINQFESRTK